MNEQERFECLSTLRKAAWDDFNRRSGYEWRMCIALWTAALAFIGMVVTDRVEQTISRWPVAVIAGLVFLLHCFWQWNVATTNRLDREKAWKIEDEMYVLSKAPRPDDYQQRVNKRKNRKLLKYWAHWYQIAVTAILLFLSVVIVA